MVTTRRGRLRTKIILWVLVPTALLLGLVAALTYGAAQRATQALVFARSEDRARLLASQLGAELAGYRQALAAVAARMDDAEIAAALGAWPGGDLGTFDGGVMLLDHAGTVVTSTLNLHQSVGTRPPALAGVVDWDVGDIPAEDLGYTGVISGAVEGMNVVAIPAVVTDRAGAPREALVGFFRIEQQAVRHSTLYARIWELYIGRLLAPDGDAGTSAMAASQRFPQPEIAYLVDGAGRVIFHPDTFMIGRDDAGREVVAGALGGRLGARRTESAAGQAVVAVAARVPRTDWLLVTEASWAAVTDSARPTTRLLVLLLALGVLLPVGIVAVGMGQITRPLARLTEAARAVAGGQFDRPIEVRTGDELETLATQFNTMAAALQVSYATLEQRVADRTRELAALNAVASTVSRSLDLAAVLDAALAETLDISGFEAGAAFRLEDNTLVLIAHRGLSGRFVQEVVRLPLPTAAGDMEDEDLSGTAAGAAVASGKPVVRRVRDYPAGAWRARLAVEGIATVVSVPLVARGRAVGVLNLVRRSAQGEGVPDGEPLVPELRSLLAAIGQQVGVAVENAALYAQAEATAAAAERNRLARDLHDAVSQTLFTASLIADTLPRLWERDPAEAAHQLGILQRLTRGAQAEMRTLLLELRPAALVETDLTVLLRHLGHAVAARADAEVTLDVASVGLLDLPVDTKIALYRIAQEALNNVVKHADAGRVWITLRPTPAGTLLEIRDDGCGFDPEAAAPDHFGLQTMCERAAALGGHLVIESAVGAGTVVRCRMKNERER
jgi:nitrate/nitrite-specific signal transduction histidine kinase